MAQGLLQEIRLETPPLETPALSETPGTERRGFALPRSRSARLAISLGLLAAACAADVLSGDEVSASLFYVVAIFAGTWLSGGGVGAALSLASTLAWFVATLTGGHTFSSVHVLAWNLGTELAIYLATATAVAQLHNALVRSHRLAVRLDHSRRLLERETREVGELQRGLLPDHPPRLAGYSWALHYETSSRAGGDYYDFFELGDGRVGILLADASGHGAPAAVLMAMTRVLVRTTDQPMTRPERVLAWVGQRLGTTLPAGWFVTASYLMLDSNTGRFTYSLAGHDAPAILRAETNTLERLTLVGGRPLGPFPFDPTVHGDGCLAPGDTLVLYTDGLPEAMGPDDDMFEEHRVAESLAGPPAELEALRERVLARVDGHRSGRAPSDDLTLILLRRGS